MLNFLSDFYVRNSFLETVEWVVSGVIAIMQFISIICLFFAMAVYMFHVYTGVVSFDLQTMLLSLMCGVVFIGLLVMNVCSLREDL